MSRAEEAKLTARQSLESQNILSQNLTLRALDSSPTKQQAVHMLVEENRVEIENSRREPQGSRNSNGQRELDENQQGVNLLQVLKRAKKNEADRLNAVKLEKELKKKIFKRELTDNDAEFIVNGKKIIIVRRSLWILDINLKLRQFLIFLTEWKWFDKFVMLLILLNSLFLASYDYTDRNDDHQRNQIINLAGRIFTIFFTVELVCKVLANGWLLHKRAYLRNGWNWLDLIVVVVGWLELLTASPNLKSIRTLRVLRPLRAINSIPSLKNQIVSLIKSLGQLVNVVLFLLFLFLIFGILGIQIYGGAFYYRCRLTPAPDQYGNWPVDESIGRLCSTSEENGWFTCPAGEYCGAPQDYGLGLENENLTSASYMNYGITNFDNIASGMLTIFTVITLEGWTDLMYMMIDSGNPIIGALFFLLLVFLGAYFLLNIILVVIISNYAETKNLHKKSSKSNDESPSSTISSYRRTLSRPSSVGSISHANEAPKKDSQASEIPANFLKDQDQTGTLKHANLALKLELRGSKTEFRKIQDVSSYSEQNSALIEPCHNHSLSLKPVAEISNDNMSQASNRKSSLPQISKNRNSSPIFDLDGVMQNEGTKQMVKELDSFENDFEKTKGLEVIQEARNVNQETSQQNSHQQFFVSAPQKQLNGLTLPINNEASKTQIGDTMTPKSPPRRQKSIYVKGKILVQNFFLNICMSKTFSIIILLLIALNTLILILDSYPIEAKVETAYGQINIFLTWFFFLEMIIKILGLGFTNYVRDKVNIFDAIVVVTTIAQNIAELVMDAGGQGNNGTVSGFRSIRLLRFFKVARTMKSFQVMIQKIALSINEILSFSILLFLFLFTNALLGLEFFADRVKFDKNGLPDPVHGTSMRPNFDDFIQAFTFIFMVMIGDNWNFYMYLHIVAVGMQSAIFFIFLQVIGKYVLLNLFLAILLENFEEIDGSESETPAVENESTQKSVTENMTGFFKKMFTRGKVSALPQTGGAEEAGMTKQLPENEKNNQTVNAEIEDDEQHQQVLRDRMIYEKTGILFDAAIGDVIEKPEEDEEKNQSAYFNRLNMNGDAFSLEESQKISLLKEKILAAKLNPDIKLGDLSKSNTIQRPDQKFGVNLQDSPDKKSKTIIISDNSALRLMENSQGFNLRDEQNPPLMAQQTKKKALNLMEKLTQPPKTSVSQESANKLVGKSLLVLDPNNFLRQFTKNIVLHPYFDSFIILIIIISTVLMAIDNPLNDPNGSLSQLLNTLDIAITSIFVTESVLKIITYGFLFNGKASYLRISWNVMDFFIVIFSVISIIFSSLNIQFIKVIRMLRVLRPLRMISRNEGLKIAVVSLFNAIPSIINALVIAFIVFALFAIFSMTLFKGTFFYCIEDNITSIVDTTQIITKWDCLNLGGDWINKVVNFDNILLSLVSMFILSGTEGWTEIMFNGVDAVDIDYNPVPNNNKGWAFFFIIFMIVGSLFILNLFVSIVVNAYYGEKEKLYKNDVLTKYQKVWLQVQTACFQEEPEKLLTLSSNKFQRYCQIMASENSWFDYFIFFCIIVNTIIMAINWYDCPPYLLQQFEYTNYFFTAAFTLEAIIKLIAFTPRGYFSQGWNIFDFLIVLISYITLIVGFAAQLDLGPKQSTIARALRIGRIFRLITKAKFLRVIFNTIIFTLPSLANVGALMFLLLFIFSILGVQIFATVALQETLNYHSNFQDFGTALLSLLRWQTGEGWNDAMADLARERSINFQCDYDIDYDSIQANNGVPNGCGSPFAFIYFILFQLIVSIVFLNLFIAVILNGFTNSNEEEGFEVFKVHIKAFKKAWQQFDPDGTGFIEVGKMQALVLQLEKESELITISLDNDPKNIRKFIAQLQVPVYENFTKYYFQDVLILLSRHYISHRYVLESLKQIDLQDDISQVAYEKSLCERQFEEELLDIQKKQEEEKIQLIEENYYHAKKYKVRMYNIVDKFQEKEGNKIIDEKIYDSSYIEWVPYIQLRLKPWLEKFKQRKYNERVEKEQLEEELHRMDRNTINANVLFPPTQNGAREPFRRGATELIIETGSQLNTGKTARRQSANRQDNNNESARQMPTGNSRSLNDDDLQGLTKNNRGQTTGEVGGTNFIGDENMENSRLEVIAINNNQQNQRVSIQHQS